MSRVAGWLDIIWRWKFIFFSAAVGFWVLRQLAVVWGRLGEASFRDVLYVISMLLKHIVPRFLSKVK